MGKELWRYEGLYCESDSGGRAGESPEVLDNARLTSDGQKLYLIKNKRTNIQG